MMLILYLGIFIQIRELLFMLLSNVNIFFDNADMCKFSGMIDVYICFVRISSHHVLICLNFKDTNLSVISMGKSKVESLSS